MNGTREKYRRYRQIIAGNSKACGFKQRMGGGNVGASLIVDRVEYQGHINRIGDSNNHWIGWTEKKT